MANTKNVPKATFQRYPIYLKALRKLQKHDVDRVMSKELADLVNIEPTTIRRDFSFLGNLGKQGYGYSVDRLVEIFNRELGMDFDEKIILIGAGNLGCALMNYNKWDYVCGEIVCAFDRDTSKCGNTQYGVPVYPIELLKEKIPKGCHIAILTNTHAVQSTVNQLVELGINGFVDFTAKHFVVPKGVAVKCVDVVSSIQELVFESNSIAEKARKQNEDE